MQTPPGSRESSDVGRARGRDFAPKKRPKQARSAATFDAIVEAAARILASEGYTALTTDRLATVSGVGVGSVYEYFDNKETIVAEVVRNMLDDLTRELASAVTRPIFAGPEAWLRDWVQLMFDAVRARRDLLRTLFDEVAYLGEIDAVRQFPMRMFALATASPREMTDLPYVNRASIFVITAMVRSAVIESVLHPPPDVPAEQLEETLVSVLLGLLAHGLAAAGRSSNR
jgi:AcrR family transcriptional regulator